MSRRGCNKIFALMLLLYEAAASSKSASSSSPPLLLRREEESIEPMPATDVVGPNQVSPLPVSGSDESRTIGLPRHVLSSTTTGASQSSTIDDKTLSSPDIKAFRKKPINNASADFEKFGELHAWRNEYRDQWGLGPLGADPASFIREFLHRDLSKADEFGNQDGCVSGDEHPDYGSLIDALGGKQGDKLCTTDIGRLTRSRVFRETVERAQKFRADTLSALTAAADGLKEKLHKELRGFQKCVKTFKQMLQERVLADSINPKTLLETLSLLSMSGNTTGVALNPAPRPNLTSEEILARITACENKMLTHQADLQRIAKCEVEETVDVGENCTITWGIELGLVNLASTSMNGTAGNTSMNGTAALLSKSGKCGFDGFGPRKTLCDLPFWKVPLLGTHNSNAYNKMELDCPQKKEVCTSWETKGKGTCSAKSACKEYVSTSERRCNQWTSSCKKWTVNFCLFGWCLDICSRFEDVCVGGYSTVQEFKCLVFEPECGDLGSFVEYGKCKTMSWSCDGILSPIVECAFENQGSGGIPKQLEQGVRAFDFDTCIDEGETAGTARMRRCHGPDGFAAKGHDAQIDLEAIRDWLNKQENKHEVVYLYWSNMNHGHLTRSDHLLLRSTSVENVFNGDKTMIKRCLDGTRLCTSVGWTDDHTLTLSKMISTNVRIVVHQKGHLDKAPQGYWDSWTEESSESNTDVLIQHMKDFCTSRKSNDIVKLSAFSGIGRVRQEVTKLYNLEDPSGAITQFTGRVMKLVNHNSCNKDISKRVNQELVGRRSCFFCWFWSAKPNLVKDLIADCNGHVHVFMVDYVEHYNTDLRQGLQSAIAKLYG